MMSRKVTDLSTSAALWRTTSSRRVSGVALALLMVITVTTVVVKATPASAAAADDVACNIVTGADRPSQQVARLYKAVFRRPPEPEGWNYWKGVIQTRSLFDIAGFFVTAPEFVNLYGAANNDEFVRLVYLNVMGRQPDSAGYEYWLGLLDRGDLSRADMVVYFSESSEFKRRENDLYIERCAKLFYGLPSVSWSASVEITDDSTQTVVAEVEYAMGYDATTNSSAYIREQTLGAGDNWLGHRAGDQDCVSWRSTDRSVVRDVLVATNMQNLELWSSASQGVTFYDNPLPDRERISDFQAAVRDAYGFGVDDCDPDDPSLIRSSPPEYNMLSEQPADFVDVQDGFVRRKFDLDTDEIGAIVNTGDSSIHDLVPTVAGDLQAIDDSAAASDQLRIQITLWEDPTGNLFLAQSIYEGVLTIDGQQWSWAEQTVGKRVPGD